jgi:protein-S-isoprenylcysteine O-methyltransferase Ste14
VDGRTAKWIGLALFVLGGLLALWAGRALGHAFTPYPEPREGAPIATGGPYRFVRHPMYVAGFVSMVGWSLAFTVLGFVFTAALALLWIFKARYEERRLLARHPEYADYRRRTPF